MHGKMPILGYIFREKAKSLAYITDMKSIEESEYEYLHDIDTLVVNALRFEKEHHSHQLVDDAIAFSRRIGAKRTYLIHLHPPFGAPSPQGAREKFSNKSIIYINRLIGSIVMVLSAIMFIGTVFNLYTFY